MDMPDAAVEWFWPGHGWTRIDTVAPLVSLFTGRGHDLKTGAPVPAEARLLFVNSAGVLDPDNPDGPWYPDLRRRQSLRVRLDPDGAGEQLFEGLIERFTPRWELDTAEMEVRCVGRLAGRYNPLPLPRSVLEHEYRSHRFLHHWPLAETGDNRVDDLIGARGGTWALPPSTGDAIVPWDPRPAQALLGFYDETDNAYPHRSPAQFALLAGFTVPDTYVVSAWVQVPHRLAVGHAIDVWAQGPLDFRTVILRLVGGYVVGAVNNYTDIDHSIVVPYPIDDGRAHHLMWWFEASPNPWSRMFIDGFERPWELNQVGGAGTTVNAGGILHLPSPGSLPVRVAHVAFGEWAEVAAPEAQIITTPLDELAAALWAAGTAPWADDLTGERFERVAAVAGITTDTTIDPGTVACGPALLAGRTFGDYAARIVATEGGALFDAPDGAIRFRQRPANDPIAVATFAGNPAGGIPYTDITPDDSLDRLVNLVDVTRDGADDPVRVDDPDSIDEFGEAPASLETVARNAAGARSAAQRLVFRAGGGRLAITGLTVTARHDAITSVGELTGLEVLDAVAVDLAPAGQTPRQVLAFVEHIDHELDWRELDWRLTLELMETVVFPTFKWDTPGRGWDRSVWPEESS